MRKSITGKRFTAFIMLSGSLLLVGCDNKTPAAKQPMTPSVGVITLQAMPLTITSELLGRTEAYRIAQVRPQVSGIILKRNFVEGSEINKDSSLYQIDPASYQASYQQAVADLAKAKAAQVMAQQTQERYQSLLGTNYVSKQEYDEAVSTLKQAKATAIAAQSAVNNAAINLKYTKVLAPITGRIGKSNVTEGALVSANQANELATIQQLDPIYVDVTQSSNDFLRLKREFNQGKIEQQHGKAKVALLLDDGSQYSQTGTLEFSDVTVDETTGAITLRAIFPNPHHDLLPGMFVRAQINEGTNPHALLVPQQGVTHTPRGEASALIVGADNKVTPKIINATQAIGNKWLVTDGLQAGDKVIITGLQKIRPGMVVNPVEAAQQSTASAAPAANQQ